MGGSHGSVKAKLAKTRNADIVAKPRHDSRHPLLRHFLPFWKKVDELRRCLPDLLHRPETSERLMVKSNASPRGIPKPTRLMPFPFG